MKFTFYLFSPFDILEFYTPSLSAGRAALQTGSLLAGQLRSGGLISLHKEASSQFDRLLCAQLCGVN